MCLEVNFKRPLPKEPIYVYKVAVKYGPYNSIKTFYQSITIKHGQYLKPVIPLTDIKVLPDVISGGVIHAYTRLKLAEEKARYSDYRILYKVLVQPEDIVCYGKDGDVALKRLKLCKKDIIYKGAMVKFR